jgi:hypothetical protein
VSLTDESDALHARVRAFARGQSHEGFDALALEIAQFQRRWSAGFRRLCAAHGGFSNVDEIPAVPSDAFRLARVAVHPPQLDVARFMTSGTSGSDRGVHALRTLETYSEVARAWGSRGLCSPKQPTRVVLALAEDPGDPGESSLGHMMRLFMGSFDGRARDAWLIGDGRVRLEACDRALGEARAVGEPLLVLAPAFALVALLEALNGRVIEAPAGTVVMQTGGFKGRTREIDPNTLRAEVARTFCIPPEQVVGEYGMTELSSQLYEGTLPGGELAAEPGVYLPPPWLRVSAVDPLTLTEVPAGETGLARFVDLANVDGAVAVLTQDLVRRRGEGIELVGRKPGAPPRGCSLAIEAMLSQPVSCSDK